MPNGNEFHIVVYGDSIQWGQGLPEPHKFSELVRQAVARMRGMRPDTVIIHRFAHSGALICRKVIDQACTPCGSPRLPACGPPINFDDPLDGEPPNPDPSIHCQLSAVGRRVDLVLVDGGINDTGLDLILNPFPLTKDDELRRLARCACFNWMRELLERIVHLHDAAHVVVTGYYPIFSPLSSMPLVITWLTALGIPLEGSSLAGPGLILRLSQLSEIWSETSSLALRDAVNDINHQLGELRVAYAHVPFGPENCLFAPSSWLFGITPALTPEDFNVAPQRIPLCINSGRGTDILCLWASVGHPNEAGAWQYYRAIMRALAELGVVRPRTILDRLFDSLRRACTWAQDLEFRCLEWREQRLRTCALEEELGINACGQWEANGYNRCDQEEVQGFNDCGNWNPFFRWLCIFWVWVTHLACVASVWVATRVCISWVWIRNMQCIVWTETLYRSCQSFTYLIKKLTCW